MTERTALYRLYDETGQLLYLGIARDPEHRWKLHSDRQPWWHLVAKKTVEWHPDRATAEDAETRLSVIEKPLYDRARKAASEVVHYDDTEDKARVTAWVLKEIAASQPGWEIGVGRAARACGTSRTSARHAMFELGGDNGKSGPLRPGPQGRFIVAGADVSHPAA
jgi:hypothetical protein